MAPVASWTPSKAVVFDIVVPTGTSPETVVDATASIVGLSEVYCVQHQGAQNFQVTVKSMGAMSLIVDAGYLVIGGERVQVVPVGPQVTNVACLFLPSFVSNEALVQALSPYGKVLTVTSGLMSARRGVLTGTRFIRMEMNAANPVPNYLRISGHRATFDYRGLQRVCRRCGSSGHLRAQCTAPFCGRCGVHGHASDGCDRPCRRCGDGHPTVVCPVRRSYSDAATGAFPPLKPTSTATAASEDVAVVKDAVLASPLQVAENETQGDGSVHDATPCASASPPAQQALVSDNAELSPFNATSVSPDARSTNVPSSQAAAASAAPAAAVVPTATASQGDHEDASSEPSPDSQDATAATSRAVAPATSTPRRVLRKTTAQKALASVREDSPAGKTERVGFEDDDPSLPAAQRLPSSDTSSEDSFSLGLSSVVESDIEMGTLREVKRGHTSSACSDEASDGRAETQRPKKPRPSSGRSKCAP
ncbi:hypothetical protein HPB50_008990 [Hyalomma asiaticum]|uniref:Uncharacterized protein n=1 Tax=Hyalomma asiaticum TaxID=266040 RepID=A0ACB7RWE9_HYAAI|nr:hypothetical protein HPB50_008990 [Hyalomma asiaticum]